MVENCDRIQFMASKTKYLTDEQVHTLYERVIAGEPIKAVAEEIGRHPFALSRVLKRRTPFVGQTMPEPLTDAQVDEIYQRVKDGEGIYQLADEFDRAAASLYRLLKRRFDYTPDPRTRWPQTLFLPNDPLVIGYIAGIVDGEGSIIPEKQHSNGGRYYVKVAMTDREVIEYLGSFGGVVNFWKKPDHRKAAWAWLIHRRRDVRHLLECIGPHLRVPAKQERCRLALESLDYFQQS